MKNMDWPLKTRLDPMEVTSCPKNNEGGVFMSKGIKSSNEELYLHEYVKKGTLFNKVH